eukprot:TRINITY_DN16315_c0_g1_i2.p1 TRINITY_DN16315_c0_g1~~TRINITY_DN16315_c0_g1_i2.p1  ORF type:complete len:656 (+),score=149.35 TRINITY_DN16315_c0_g1_i2:121-2088(+)
MPDGTYGFDFLVSHEPQLQRHVLLYCHRELEKAGWHHDEQRPEVLMQLMHGALGAGRDPVSKVHWLQSASCVQMVVTRVFYPSVQMGLHTDRQLSTASADSRASSATSPTPSATSGGLPSRSYAPVGELSQTLRTPFAIAGAVTLFKPADADGRQTPASSSPSPLHRVGSATMARSLQALRTPRMQQCALSDTHSQFDDHDPLSELENGADAAQLHGYTPSSRFGPDGAPEGVAERLELLEAAFPQLAAMLGDGVAEVEAAVSDVRSAIRSDLRVSIPPRGLLGVPLLRSFACRMREGVVAVLAPPRRLTPLRSPDLGGDALAAALASLRRSSRGELLWVLAAQMATACLSHHHGWLQQPVDAACRLLVTGAEPEVVDAMMQVAAFYLRVPQWQHKEDPLLSAAFPPPGARGSASNLTPVAAATSPRLPPADPPDVCLLTARLWREKGPLPALVSLRPASKALSMLSQAATAEPPVEAVMLVSPARLGAFEGRYERVPYRRANGMPVYRRDAAPIRRASPPRGRSGAASLRRTASASTGPPGSAWLYHGSDCRWWVRTTETFGDEPRGWLCSEPLPAGAGLPVAEVGWRRFTDTGFVADDSVRLHVAAAIPPDAASPAARPQPPQRSCSPYARGRCCGPPSQPLPRRWCAPRALW